MKRTLLGQLRVGFFSVASHGRPNQKLLGPSRTLTGSTTTSTSTNRNLWTFTSAENSLSKIFHGQNGRGCLNGGNLAAGGPHRFFLPRSSPTPSHIFQATRRLTTSDGDDNDLDLFPSTDEPVVCEDLIRREVAADLFHQYARVRQDGVASLDVKDVANLLREIGKEPTEEHLQRMFSVADQDNNGVIDIHEFLEHYDYILDGNPARIILVVGGPGSGKGVLSAKLQKHCGVVHLSSGDLLRTEVARGSALGNQVRDIMARGELVSSAIMVALMKRRMRDHPGKRVLLDGFPRSLENAHDLVALCGKPELALHLVRGCIFFLVDSTYQYSRHLCFCTRSATTPSCWNALLGELALKNGKMTLFKQLFAD